jgi:PEP-CTERM motif-containing protein
MKFIGLMAAVAAGCIAAPASAAIIIGVGAGELQPDENLLFNNNPAPGASIEGWTNNTAALVTLTGGETLIAAGGQARLDAQDNTISSTFNYKGLSDQLVGVNFTDPALAFTTTEFRLFGGTATQATLTFVDTAGQAFTRTFDIPANGFFNARATDGQQIDYFTISANGTIGDVRQIRIGGIADVGVVPEPAAWALMILGSGGAGAMLRRRRSAAVA